MLNPEDLISFGTLRLMSARTLSQNFIYYVRINEAVVNYQTDDEVSKSAWVPIEEVFKACLIGLISNESTIVAVLRARLLGLI